MIDSVRDASRSYPLVVNACLTYTPFTRYNRFDNRFDNGFDNRLYRVYKHLPGCQTGLTTGLTTGCIV